MRTSRQRESVGHNARMARCIGTARGGQWTAVQVGAILRRVGHFASDRSIKQQTTDSALKVVVPHPCHRIEPLPGVDSRPSSHLGKCRRLMRGGELHQEEGA
jgi:hypothetical protein